MEKGEHDAPLLFFDLSVDTCILSSEEVFMRLIDTIRAWAIKEAFQEKKPAISVTQVNAPDLGETPVQTLQRKRKGTKSKVRGPGFTDKIKNDNEASYKPTVHGVRQR